MVFCNMAQFANEGKVIASHNPYFNRWFSAIAWRWKFQLMGESHNPYFNRWFSAI